MRQRTGHPEPRPVVEYLGRAGLAARGVVYVVIGVLALEVALGVGGKTASQSGALETIRHQPLGGVLLVVVAVGLAGYAAWQLMMALTGRGADGALDRLAAGAGAAGYGALCFTAIKILTGSSPAGGTNSPKREAAGVLAWGVGPVLVGAVGAILIGVALYQAYLGITRRFLQDSETQHMDPPVRRSFVALAVFGHVARAVIFALVGYGLLRAAIDYSPRSAVGLDGALANLAHTGAGPLLLGAVAAGLVGFGLYSIADARYHRM
jgi:hypothetical protein